VSRGMDGTRALVTDTFAFLVRATTVTGVGRTRNARRLRVGRGDALDVQGATPPIIPVM